VINLEKIKRWLKTRKLQSEERYTEEKKEFENAIGEPTITIRIGIPEGFENQCAQFLNLEQDPQFLEEVKDLVKKRLVYEKRGVKRPS
jgi:hypothetical protein